MENSKKTFIAGINADDSFFAHTEADNLDALNVRVVSSSEGKAGSISNVNGTRLVPNYQSFNDVKVVGSYEDSTSNNVFYFLANKNNNASVIYCYKPKEDNIFKVLSDNNLDSTYSLNFNPDKPITGIGYIDNILYWTGVDGKEPFRINVERGIKTNLSSYVTTETAYVTPISKSIVTLIRKPPMLPLITEVQEDSSRDTSFLKSRTHTFAYRYVYKDGETSVFSPASYFYPNQDMDNDNHKKSKKIKVDFPKFEAESYGISQDVHKVQFAVKFDKDTSYFIWKEFDSITHATQFGNQVIGSQGVITAEFYNDVLGFAVDDVNSIKLYDTVPYEAEALSIARNRLFLGNIKEGRSNPKQINSSDVSLQLLTANLSDSFNQYDRNRGGKVGFSHASAYQIGIAFFDFAGRTGGVLTDDSLKVITPERNLSLNTYNSFIEFTLNESLRSKIPDWAEYYAVVRTKNLTKDFTLSNLSDKIRYFQTASTGNFSVNIEKLYPTTTDNDNKGLSGTPTGTFEDQEFVSFSTEHEGLAIGLGDLTSYKQGYTYQEGDRIKLITENSVFEAAVTGQEGKYVKINLYNFNNPEYLNTSALSNVDYSTVYEIYSPHKIQPNEFYYEAFNGRILRQPNALPSFSDTTGQLIGDVYLKSLIADTSTLPSFFFEGKSSTESGQDHEIDGEIKYIDFPIFYGEGINDMSCNTGVNNGSGGDDLRFDIKISSTGTPDKFKWRKRARTQLNSNVGYSSEVSITGSSQTLSDGVTVNFAATTGHTLNDRWVVNYKVADNSAMNEEHRRAYGIYPGGPNGTILVGSDIRVYFTEYKGGTWVASEDRRTWDLDYPGSGVDKTYANIEELFWETSFGTQVVSAAQGGMSNFAFRRGTLDPIGNGAQTQLNILDHETNPGSQSVSITDGTTIHMIYEGVLKKTGGGRNIDSTNNINVDYIDEFSYAAESMNPSNDYFLNWTQITGKPNLVPSEVSSQIKTTGIVFSETKIPGSKINGLSKFSALDEKRLDDATGPLRSLLVTSKTQSTGSIMLAISENETSSIYLGEQQLQQTSSGGQFLAVSSGVIGTINSLQGSYGTSHPESVAVNEGKAFWFDVKNQTAIKYDSNGLTAIGDVKMKTFFKEKSDIINSDTIPHFVVGTYDDYNSEYILTIPRTGEVTTVLQQDPYYPDTPVIEITNEGTEPSSKVITVEILEPWSMQFEVTIIDGVGTITFTSPYTFTIPSGVVQTPSGSNITVTNAATGGFAVSNNTFSGSGKLTISNVFGDIDYISLQLSRIKEPSTSAIVVSNLITYTNDTKLDFGAQASGNTPIRVTGATDGDFPMFEVKSLTPSNGTLTIPCTSVVPWQFGASDNNSTNFTECELGVCSDIAANRITTNATAITASSTTIGYQPGTFNITITGINEDIDSIVIDSRPLKRAVFGSFTFDDITASGLSLNSSIVLNKETATEFGFVYSTTDTNPSIGETGVTKVALSGSTSDMSHTITGLSADTTVYSKAYLISNFGTKYGICYNQATGSANNTVPAVTSDSFSSTNNRFTGIITSNGGSSAGTNGITERGWVYSSSDNTPTIGESGVVKVTALQVEIDSFPYTYTSLNAILASGTTYYWRAYAKNDVGTAYGNVKTIATADTSVGIGGFTLQSNSVSGNGGYVQVDVTKNVQTGIVAGDITFIISASTSILQSEEVAVAFTNTQTIDSVQVYIPANYSGSSRYINLKVNLFDGIPNKTGQSEPVTIQGVINQVKSSFQP
jgi:hypothetical protein